MNKKFKLSVLLLVAISFLQFSSCTKDQTEQSSIPIVMEGCTKDLQMGTDGASVSSHESPYKVHISDLNKVGNNWVWIWQIKNTKPGNGTNGTVQDLTSWGIGLGEQIKLGDIVQAAYSTDKINWTTFTPKFEADNDQTCSSNRYVKFDFGTSGAKPSYYKLVITKNIAHTNTEALYQSGAGCGVFMTCGFGLSPQPSSTVKLGTACDFSILAKSGISTTGTTSIAGDIGVSPIAATAITGFGLIMDPSNQFSITPIVVGKVYAANYADPTPAKMTKAIIDMETSFTTLNNLTAPPSNVDRYAGNISGKILTPGNYKWSTGVSISDAGVTLNGGLNDIWVFQIAGDLTVNNNASITLTGGAQAKNIYWVVSGQATLGTNVDFKGTILSKSLISLNSGAKVTGRLLAQTAVTLISSKVIPTPCTP